MTNGTRTKRGFQIGLLTLADHDEDHVDRGMRRQCAAKLCAEHRLSGERCELLGNVFRRSTCLALRRRSARLSSCRARCGSIGFRRMTA
jgi:hypothetical protein